MSLEEIPKPKDNMNHEKYALIPHTSVEQYERTSSKKIIKIEEPTYGQIFDAKVVNEALVLHTIQSKEKFRKTKEEDFLIVNVSSAGFDGGNFALVTLNGLQVDIDYNEDDHYRGLHIVVYNPFEGKIEAARVFDTYRTSTQLDEFIDDGVQKGHIVVAACMDECSNKLSYYAKMWFRSMGSEEIWDLEYRDGFVFIGVCGETDFQESRSKTKY